MRADVLLPLGSMGIVVVVCPVRGTCTAGGGLKWFVCGHNLRGSPVDVKAGRQGQCVRRYNRFKKVSLLSGQYF